MQNKQKIKLIKATIFYIIVAFLVVSAICCILVRYGKEKFLMATNLINMISIDTNNQDKKATSVLKIFEEEDTTILLNPPEYGAQYATLKISSIDVDLPVYYGKTFDLLKKGIGHDNKSYFPGEGGSIVLMGHNYSKFLGNLPHVKIGDQIQMITDYGEFNYTIYNTQIVHETETNKVPITEEEEILMIYTCWPINNIGYATERYVVYAK